jgi:cytochrome P450
MAVAQLADPLNPLKQDFLDNPYPTLERFRTEAPVWWSAKNEYWLVSRYADTQAILRDLNYEKQIQRWRSSSLQRKLLNKIQPFKSLLNATSTWMLNLNPPDHTRVRSLLNKAFTPTMVQKLKPEIETIAESLLDDIEAQGSMELMHEFAFPLPISVIGQMLGVPMTDRALLKHCSDNLAGVVGGQRQIMKLARAGKAIRELRAYLRPLIEQRRTSPQDDLMSVLVQAEEEHKKLTADEVVNNCILLLVAGHETTVNLIGNALHCLLKHPDQLQLLREQPELMEATISEVLRFESPVQLAPRLAGQDLEFNSKTFKKGQMIFLLLGSANRDAEQFKDADRFDITRAKNRNMAFGEGIHRCIGASLAEVEAQIAITALLRRFPKLGLKSNPVRFKKPFGLRGPESLQIVWQ